MTANDIVTVVLLLLLGGLVSYLGDVAGRRWARSRRRFFGLRPRHASAVWAGLVGVMVAGFIFVLLVVASANFRDAVFQIDDIKAQRRAALDELDVVSLQLDGLQSRYETLSGDFDRLEGSLETAVRENEALAEERERLVETRDSLEREIGRLGTEMEDLTGQVAALEEERNGLQEELALRQVDIDDLRVREATLIAGVDNLEGQLDELQTQMEETQATYDELNREYLALLSSLQAYQEGTILAARGQEMYRLLVTEVGAEVEAYLEERFRRIEEELVGVGLSLGAHTPSSLAARALSLKGPGLQFLRVKSARNAFAGDAVDFDLEWMPVRRVFDEGEVLVERTMARPGDVEQNLTFLEEEMLPTLRDLARERGMLPDRRTQLFVQVPVATLLATAQAMSERPDGVTVVFRATSPVYNFETLTGSRFEITLED